MPCGCAVSGWPTATTCWWDSLEGLMICTLWPWIEYAVTHTSTQHTHKDKNTFSILEDYTQKMLFILWQWRYFLRSALIVPQLSRVCVPKLKQKNKILDPLILTDFGAITQLPFLPKVLAWLPYVQKQSFPANNKKKRRSFWLVLIIYCNWS